MKYTRCLFIIVVIFMAGLAHAQRGGRWNTTQNEPPESELIVARWHFGDNGLMGGYGWAHNYPSSDQNLNQYISEATGIDLSRMSYRIVELGQDEVFDYPFAYISEPGEMALTATEVGNLRKFIQRGGFVLLDDFDGSRQLAIMKQQVRRAFPEFEWVPLEIEHKIFHMHFELDDLHGMDPYVPGSYVTYYALHNAAGDVVMIAGHNNDLANFWDWYDQAVYPLRPAADAFRLGVNYIVYALTH